MEASLDPESHIRLSIINLLKFNIVNETKATTNTNVVIEFLIPGSFKFQVQHQHLTSLHVWPTNTSLCYSKNSEKVEVLKFKNLLISLYFLFKSQVRAYFRYNA